MREARPKPLWRQCGPAHKQLKELVSQEFLCHPGNHASIGPDAQRKTPAVNRGFLEFLWLPIPGHKLDGITAFLAVR